MQKARVGAEDMELSVEAKAVNNMYVAAEVMGADRMQGLVAMVALILQPLYTSHSETARAMKSQETVFAWYELQARGHVFSVLERLCSLAPRRRIELSQPSSLGVFLANDHHQAT